MSSEEAFWIVPSPPLRARPNHVDGPYASLDEAQKAGEGFSFAFLIMRTRLSDTSLEIVGSRKADVRSKIDEATSAANEVNRPSGPRR